MVNSRGGFLVEDPDDLGEKAAIEKRRQEERAQAKGAGAFEPGKSLGVYLVPALLPSFAT